MDHNVKPSEVVLRPNMAPLPVQVFRHLTQQKSPKLDPYLEGYISAFAEQGFNYAHILNKCTTKGHQVTMGTIEQFVNALYRRNIRQRGIEYATRGQSFSSNDSDERKITIFEVCSRGIITTLNLLFFIVSALMIAIGCIIKYGSANWLHYLEPIFDSIQNISAQKHYPLGHISISHLILEAATASIIIGSILLGIAWFGWCGALCRKRSLLIVYCSLLTFILALQVTVVICLVVMRTRVDLALKKPWKETLLHQYKGIQGQNTVSVSWNYIMNSLECCGVEGSEDFDKSREWDRIYHDPHTMRSVHLSIPMVCCKNLGSYPNIQPPKNFTCAIAPTRYNSNYKMGCYNEIWKYISRAELSLACIMMIATIIQMLLIFASVYLISKSHPDYEYGD